MPATLLAIYRRPEGGDEAVETFLRRYRFEHLPLVRRTPGLRSVEVERVAQAFGETDVFMVARMLFDDREALDAGLSSSEMRAAGKNLREIAPGLSTVLIMEAMEMEETGSAGGFEDGSQELSGPQRPASGAGRDRDPRDAIETEGVGGGHGTEETKTPVISEGEL